MSKALYPDRILAYYHSTIHKRVLPAPDIYGKAQQVACGDVITIQGMVHDTCLKKVHFQGEGCIISQAAAAMVAEYVEGKQIQEILAMREHDVSALLGFELGPVRMQCALLMLDALQQAIKDYKP